MKPVPDPHGTILNAMVLTVDLVTQKRVRCPVCALKDFEMWTGARETAIRVSPYRAALSFHLHYIRVGIVSTSQH